MCRIIDTWILKTILNTPALEQQDSQVIHLESKSQARQRSIVGPRNAVYDLGRPC
jgi:hypothetical protein